MTTEVLFLISALLENLDKHIEVVDRHDITAKQKSLAQIKMCDDNDNEETFNAKLQNVLLAPDLCDNKGKKIVA